MPRPRLFPVVLFGWFVSLACGADGNRLAYLDEPCSPYYVGQSTAKLTTPQWIGEPGVEAAVVLAVDDLGDTARYERFLRPILDRLKKIDGRAALSLMATQVAPDDPQVRAWLDEGLSVETHTWDHQCPCLQGAGLAAAKQSYDRTVDRLAEISKPRPTTFRMPCCDSMSSVSPRFFMEVMGKTTAAGNFLLMDSSVFHLFSAYDAVLPRDLIIEPNGRERFRKYVPGDRVMVNLVEDYPYPYVIGRLLWEIPTVMPSDWDAQHLHGVNNPATVADFKAAIDAVVIKRGIFSICFHPHGWIGNQQIVELIDYADAKYGRKVKFLNFGEVCQRLTSNLLSGQTLRASRGEDNGVRVLDVDHDGFMDVLIGNETLQVTRRWSPQTGRWVTSDLPVRIVTSDGQGCKRDAGTRFGVLQANGYASVLVSDSHAAAIWHFDGQGWKEDKQGLAGLDAGGSLPTFDKGKDRGVRLRDIDGDGQCELIVGMPQQRGVFRWSPQQGRWTKLPFSLPEDVTVVDSRGGDAGLRLVDVDEDGRLDVVFSNSARYSVHLFASTEQGWSRQILAGRRGDPGEIPPLVRADGTNNGAWFKDRHLWVQNEDTGKGVEAKSQVESRSFATWLEADAQRPSH